MKAKFAALLICADASVSFLTERLFALITQYAVTDPRIASPPEPAIMPSIPVSPFTKSTDDRIMTARKPIPMP